MAKFRVTTTVDGYTGERAGVRFADGVAEVDSQAHPAALAYFRRHGYGVEEIAEAKPAAKAPAKS